MFDLKRTYLNETMQLEKTFKFFRNLKKLLLIVLILFAILLLLAFFSGSDALPRLINISIIILSLFLMFSVFNIFFEDDLKDRNPKIPLEKALEIEAYNLAEFFNFNSAKYMSNAIKLSKKSGLAFPTSSQILYSFLDEKNPKINFLFSRLSLDVNAIKSDLADILANKGSPDDSKDFEAMITEAAKSAAKRNGTRIKEGDIISALSETEPLLKKILTDLELGREDTENISWWIESTNKKMRQAKRFWDYENLIKSGSIGNDWAYGYTITLDQFSIDWSHIVGQRGYEEIIGHDNEVSVTEEVLSRKGSRNALIVGEIGSGRKNIIHAIIKKSLSNRSYPAINNKRFLQLDIVSLSANVSSFEKTEGIIERCFREAQMAGNVVLIINDLHDFLGAKRKAGVIDISGIILPYLNDMRMQIIGITDYKGLHQYIEAKPAILNYFQKIEVPELSKEETMLILENRVFPLEHEHQKFITYAALKEIINLSEKYISSPFPQKAIMLLQDSFSYGGKLADTPLILPEHVDQILSERVQIPLGKVKDMEKDILLNLEEFLHKRVISQNEAIVEISSAMRRARAGVQTRKGPMGAFLFLGPTGVGKTETAKALAEAYFGSEDRMIRLDMSEFQRTDDIPRLLGSDNQNGILTTQVRDNPFSLVLLDEIEKAHPNILNLFLQVLDEGHISDNLGQKVNFSNTIIIATSNAGYQVILDAFKINKPIEETKKELLDYIFTNNMFRPEFINRFDGVVVFKSLTQEDLMKVSQIQLQKLKDALAVKKIEFIITEELKRKIVELGYDPVFGARQMRRVIQDNVENSVAKALLGDAIKPGDTIELNPENFEVVLK